MDSTVFIEASHFSYSEAYSAENPTPNIDGSFISVQTQSKLSLKDCSFVNGFGAKGGAIAFLGYSWNFISGCRFQGNEAWDKGGAIYGYNYVKLELKNTEFEGNREINKGDGNSIYSTSPSVE